MNPVWNPEGLIQRIWLRFRELIHSREDFPKEELTICNPNGHIMCFQITFPPILRSINASPAVVNFSDILIFLYIETFFFFGSLLHILGFKLRMRSKRLLRADSWPVSERSERYGVYLILYYFSCLSPHINCLGGLILTAKRKKHLFPSQHELSKEQVIRILLCGGGRDWWHSSSSVVCYHLIESHLIISII